MLYEPYIAAEQLQIKTVTHVRELPEHDEHIRDLLGETAEDTIQRLHQLSNFFIANSALTASWIRNDAVTSVIYNKVKIPSPVEFNRVSESLQVCMLSSNIQKKGIEDCFKIAAFLKGKPIKLNLYGPETHELKALLEIAKNDNLNIEFKGYTNDPYLAIQQNEVVICLSWFQESFGRTAAEAMINGRIVVGYHWGALSEIVDDSCGVLVPFRDIEGIANALNDLVENHAKRKQLSNNARVRAEKLFTSGPYQAALRDTFESILQA